MGENGRYALNSWMGAPRLEPVHFLLTAGGHKAGHGEPFSSIFAEVPVIVSGNDPGS
jgi:hypothetical protein